MRVTYLDSHRESAQRLYRQRRLALAQGLQPLPALRNIEQRLRAHLYLLAEVGDKPQPRRAPAAFVATAISLLRADTDAIPSACELLGRGGDVAQAVLDALALLPPAEQDALMQAYHDEPALRPSLLSLWRRTRAKLPKGFVHSTELQREAPELAVAALRYLAADPALGLETFRAYYAKPLDRAVDSALLQAALWGGLLRRDPDAHDYLRRGYEQVGDRNARRAFLRLMALTGDVQFEPVLSRYAADEPAHGLYLLSRYGRPRVAEQLLDALDELPTAEAADGGWQWLTGQALPRRPRLGLIEGELERALDAGSVPDAMAARRYWHHNGARFNAERYAMGRELNPKGLVLGAGEWAGRAGVDLLDLLALQLGPRALIDPEGWVEHRQAHLKSLGVDTGPELPDDLYERDPWEHGHYA